MTTVALSWRARSASCAAGGLRNGQRKTRTGRSVAPARFLGVREFVVMAAYGAGGRGETSGPRIRLSSQ